MPVVLLWIDGVRNFMPSAVMLLIAVGSAVVLFIRTTPNSLVKSWQLRAQEAG